jgi:hypothetical protein
LSTLDRFLDGPAFPFLVVAWLLGWIAGSIVFRLQRGKPIVPRLPVDAIFKERAASGRSRKNFLTAIGGASNCLMVAVTADEFIVTPFFPFTLMFLPEIYDLEVRVPRGRARISNPASGLFGRNVTVSVEQAEPYEMTLRLRNQAAFLAAMASPASGSRR